MSEEHKPIVKIRGVALGKSLCELAALPATAAGVCTAACSSTDQTHVPRVPWMPLLWSSDKKV
uniref:Uncharacterized protein n=1 Tax=Anguilla anguilla TaxID=7936 RepID=A0A0E9XUG7_ANGAN